MNRHIVVAWNATVFALVIASLSNHTAFGRDRTLRDDQIPYGTEGTIGRGTDGHSSAPVAGTRLGGSGSASPSTGYFWYSPSAETYSRGYSSPPEVLSTPAVPRSYRTNRVHQAGDGQRYPLYYDPATRRYFYYPGRR